MFNFRRLIGRPLVGLQIGHNHEKVHHAWQDETNKGFLICYDINLEFEDGHNYSIKPCDVNVIDSYPALSLCFEEKHNVEVLMPFNINGLPMRVCNITQIDQLGEEVINQYTFFRERKKHYN